MEKKKWRLDILKITNLMIVVASLALVCCIGAVMYAFFGLDGNEVSNDTPDLIADQENTKESAKDTPSNEAEDTTDEIKTGEPTFGSTFKFDGLEITFSDSIEYATVDNQFADEHGAEVVKVPVTVTNITEDLNGLNMFFVTVYGSQGRELSDISAYFDDDFTWAISSESLRGGATATAYCYFLYDGNGDYYIKFDNYSEKIEVKLPITK